MSWSSEPELSPKIQRVEAAIRRAQNDRKKIVIVGESAGAAIALKIYADGANLHKLITVCGVANPGIHIGTSIARRTPALHTVIEDLRTARFPKKAGVMHCYRAAYDEVISSLNTIAPGARVHTLWATGHSTTIALSLTLYSPIIIKSIRR